MGDNNGGLYNEIDRLTKENDNLSGCLVTANENIVERNATIEQLKAGRDDLKDYYATAMREPCSDEIHCTCVPALRKRAEVAEEKCDRFAEDYRTALQDGLVTAGALEDVMAERDRLLTAADDVVKMWERLWRKTGLKKHETMNRKETVLYDAVKALNK